LWYNATYDRIDCFHDVGGGRRSLEFADHAMVIMAKGIFRKWKQPIAYYFANHTMCTADIKAKIRESILHGIGLKCISTVCDQGNSNGPAVRELIQETRVDCLKRGTENKMFGFSVDGAEVIPLFDVPHLLKCVRNNMMLNDYVFFKWKNGWQKAYWKHIIQLFKEDNDDYDFRMLNKLSERHVYQGKIKKMKVCIAAQVMSQCVSATMRKLAKGKYIAPVIHISIGMDQKYGNANSYYDNCCFQMEFYLLKRLEQLTSFCSWISCLIVVTARC